MLELKAEHPEQHQQQPGPEAFPLEAISRATVQFPQRPVQIISYKCRLQIPLCLGYFGTRTIEKKITQTSTVLVRGYSCVLNCCALPIAACIGLPMRTSACEEKKVIVFSAQQV